MINLLRFVWNHPLNEKRRFFALWRVLSWQVACRLLEGPIAFPFVENSKLFATRGTTGATGNWYCGLHEVDDMAFVLHTLRENEHFLDVGANIGSYTVLAAAGPGARVTAIEPIPSTYRKLQLNVSLNEFGHLVRACNIGLSDKSGTLRFSSEMDTVNHVLAKGESNVKALEIPVMKLDDLIGDDCPRIIKIDVEGHELPALKGAATTLANPYLLAIIMETNGSGKRYGWKDEELFELMKQKGFESFGYDPFKRELLQTSAAGSNTIFVRDKKEIEDRVKSAPIFHVGSTNI